ncbi:sterol desaturase family protein [Leptospira barantonii]|uniref:Sterol desaturase family protein n=1 Tax=Leptospira barantonii TaxID=2023184 RepID=A0A5F2B573_9LEPT|nr:sterol desaturase family protein [Leptospira barantonii]TGM00507.1 sterol desaturase family protein [Leptospira barantonii]
MDLNLVVLFIPCLFVLIVVEVLYSSYRGIPAYRWNDSLDNLATGISNQIFIVLFHTITIAGYLWIYHHWRIFDLPAWPGEPLWWMPTNDLFGISSKFMSFIIVAFTWIVCLFVYEFAYYWNHRFSHEINFLWAGHIVHHQSEEYNLGVAFRQASFRGLFTWVFYLPLAWIGFPPAVMIFNAQFSLIYQFLIHTKFVSKMPHWFESIFNTPSHHRVHHGRNPRYIDKNYGGMFIFFDKWFGTFEPETETPVYGITTQLKSFNPLWANFHYWWEMIQSAKKSSNWKEKVNVFFASPRSTNETKADDGNEFRKEKDVYHEKDESVIFEKYDIPLSRGLLFYVLFWSFAAILISFLALLNVGRIPETILHNVFFASILTFVCVGGICDRKKWVLFLEPIRLFYLCLTFFPWFGASNLSFVLLGFHLISFVYFLKFYQSFIDPRRTDFGKRELETRIG